VIVFCLAAFALIDDLRSLPVKSKLIVQVLAAALVIFLYQDSIFLLGSAIQSPSSILLAFLLLLYLVAATNFFNFMDGINGIAGIEAITSFLFVGLFHLIITNNNHLLILCIAVCAASAGFLLLNFPQARVFMGDTGSTYLGFLFAVLVVLSARNLKEFLILLLFQGIFYIDCIFTIFLRRLRKENIFMAHKLHLYQELVHKKGWSHTKVTLIYGGIQVLIGALAWLIMPLSELLICLYWILLMGIYMVLRLRFFDIMDHPDTST
jgi:Fuc2NAc and GlcNAc transferase